jgi:hypothetical protein
LHDPHSNLILHWSDQSSHIIYRHKGQYKCHRQPQQSLEGKLSCLLIFFLQFILILYNSTLRILGSLVRMIPQLRLEM